MPKKVNTNNEATTASTMNATKIRDAMDLINRLLSEGHEVRIKPYYVHACTHIICDGVVIDSVDGAIIYPGYLNLTKAGTPARICALEDRGGFGAPHLKGVNSWRCCMTHIYNDHDRENCYNSDEGGEDRYLDASYEE